MFQVSTQVSYNKRSIQKKTVAFESADPELKQYSFVKVVQKSQKNTYNKPLDFILKFILTGKEPYEACPRRLQS